MSIQKNCLGETIMMGTHVLIVSHLSILKMFFQGNPPLQIDKKCCIQEIKEISLTQAKLAKSAMLKILKILHARTVGSRIR